MVFVDIKTSSVSIAGIAMSKDNKQTVTGTVVECLPNTMFRVQVEGQEELLLAYLSGKMKLYRIRILVGDTVEVLVDPYGGKGRVIKRL
jgi:translation initiation factor IF-1